MRFSVVSLGCPKNLTDTETMVALLKERGYELVPEDNSPEMILLNTCGFIAPAVAESTAEIERFCELRRRGVLKKLVVAGCLVQRSKKDIAARFPEIDVLVGVGGQEEIVRLIESDSKKIAVVPKLYLENLPKLQLTMPHTAYLKIADGCDHRCTFCTIPQIRGAYRSRPIDDIIAEVKNLVRRGVRELSLVGQDTTSYGIDLYRSYRLPELIRRLAQIDGLSWIRLLYAYPETVTPELIEVIAGEDKLCKYLDMPIQHISDRILRLMKRPTTGAQVRKVIEQLKNKVKGIGLRTTVIAGFPGETPAEFEQLLKFVKEVEFSRLGVFAYWQEKGTQAAGLSHQVEHETKEARVTEIVSAQSVVIDRINNELIGKTMNILSDTIDYGRTQYQAPDIDGGVQLNSGKLTPGSFAQVKITGADGYLLTGEMAT